MYGNKNFCITNGKGFYMTFANGVSASVQWGIGNYCDNHFSPNNLLEQYGKDMQSDTAEVAAMDEYGKFITAKVAPDMIDADDQVIGFLSPEQVLDFLVQCRDYKGEV